MTDKTLKDTLASLGDNLQDHFETITNFIGKHKDLLMDYFNTLDIESLGDNLQDKAEDLTDSANDALSQAEEVDVAGKIAAEDL